jgi:CRISPR-associated protein Cas1
MSVLYLTEQQASVRLDAETLVVRVPEDRSSGRAGKKTRIPLNKVTQVVVYGNVTLTTPAIAALLERRSEICLLTRFGEFVGRVSGDDHKYGQLRMMQTRAHDDPALSLYIASVCVRAKLHNQRTLLLRSNRTREDGAIAQAAEQMEQLEGQIDGLLLGDADIPDPRRPQQDSGLGRLMGIEGAAASAYFGAFGRLLGDEWAGVFNGRHKRPPSDPINALLSYGYTLLTTQAVASAQIVGFDPYIGYLHSTQYGKPALALDVIEMFRAPIVDSVVVTLLNNRMLTAGDFTEALGSWRMSDEGRRTFLQKYEERLNTEIEHPVLKTKVTYRRCLELQFRLLSRWLQGELKRFRGFHSR